MMVWPELSPELIPPMAYRVHKTVSRVARKQLHFFERHKLDQIGQIDARSIKERL